jgi:LPXTG-motif cell wall-anchored protein
MTVKPTGDDTWTILVVAAILVAGSAVFLGKARAATA